MVSTVGFYKKELIPTVLTVYLVNVTVKTVYVCHIHFTQSRNYELYK